MIPQFNTLNPVVRRNKPFFDEKTSTFYCHVFNNYKWYLEASKDKPNGDSEYYILLGKTQFDINCRRCNVDQYGRLQFKPLGELLDYIKRETKERGNINVTFCDNSCTDSNIPFDVYSVL